MFRSKKKTGRGIKIFGKKKTEDSEEPENSTQYEQDQKGNKKLAGNFGLGDHIYDEYHPCLHKWQRKYPQQTHPKLPRLVPYVPEHLDKLAEPLCRRLLTLWLNHSEILPEARRDKLLSRLLDCGFKEEELARLMAEERRKEEIKRRIAEAGPFDVLDEDGNLLSPAGKKKKSGKKKGKCKGSAKSKGGKKKKEKKGGKKKGKSGGNGKAGGKKGKTVGKKGKSGGKKGKGKTNDEEDHAYRPGKPGQLKAGWPHDIGVKLMLKIWALADSLIDETYISAAPEYFDVQATALLHVMSQGSGNELGPESHLSPYINRMITGCLNFAVWLGQHVTGPAQSIPEEMIPKLLAMRGDDVTSKIRNSTPLEENNEEDDEKTPQRRWTQHEFQFITPARQSQQAPENSIPQDEGNTGQFTFLHAAKWYDPQAPEFLYAGPRVTPRNVVFTDDGWMLENVADMEAQPLIPQSVPPYYPQLRPLQHPAGQDLTSTRQAWYIMNHPDFYQSNSLSWDTAATVEIFEMVFNIVHTMIATPNLNINRLLEMISELCLAIKLAKDDEAVTTEAQNLDDRRTIIFEKMFINLFTSDFRDFNDTTADLMRTLCHRAAVSLRYLYQHTAVMLWHLQQYHPSPQLSGDQPDEEVEELEAIAEWDDWLRFLWDATNLAKRWQKWLALQIEAIEELPEDRIQLRTEGEKWIAHGKASVPMVKQFVEKSVGLKPINHRLTFRQTEINESDDGDSWIGEQNDTEED